MSVGIRAWRTYTVEKVLTEIAKGEHAKFICKTTTLEAVQPWNFPSWNRTQVRDFAEEFPAAAASSTSPVP